MEVIFFVKYNRNSEMIRRELYRRGVQEVAFYVDEEGNEIVKG